MRHSYHHERDFNLSTGLFVIVFVQIRILGLFQGGGVSFQAVRSAMQVGGLPPPLLFASNSQQPMISATTVHNMQLLELCNTLVVLLTFRTN